MTDDVNEPLHKAVQDVMASDEDLPDSVVVGWAMIVETVGPDGRRSLHRMDRGPDGKRLAPWQRNGYFFDGLHGTFPEPMR